MRTIYKINSAVMISAGLLICSVVQAQEKYKTTESIGKQFMQNSVPGLKYGSEVQRKQENEPVDSKRDTKGNIRDVLFTGGIPTAAGQTLRTNNSGSGKSVPVRLLSDSKVPELDKKPAEAVKLPPMQGGAKEPVGQPSPSI